MVVIRERKLLLGENQINKIMIHGYPTPSRPLLDMIQLGPFYGIEDISGSGFFFGGGQAALAKEAFQL